jgi:hypothetical protein
MYYIHYTLYSFLSKFAREEIIMYECMYVCICDVCMYVCMIYIHVCIMCLYIYII